MFLKVLSIQHGISLELRIRSAYFSPLFSGSPTQLVAASSEPEPSPTHLGHFSSHTHVATDIRKHPLISLQLFNLLAPIDPAWLTLRRILMSKLMLDVCAGSQEAMPSCSSWQQGYWAQCSYFLGKEGTLSLHVVTKLFIYLSIYPSI